MKKTLTLLALVMMTVAVMRDAHVLVDAVEGDVMGRLRQGSDSHHHQGKEGKGLFHNGTVQLRLFKKCLSFFC